MSQDSPGIHYREIAPPPSLSSVVQCFWFLRGNLGGAPPQTIVPDGRMEIVLHLAEPFAKVDGRGVPRLQGHALVAGQLVAPLRLQPGGVSDVVGVRLRPAGARSLFSIPVHELGGAVTRLELVAPRLAAGLTDAATAEADPVARARNLGTALGRMLTSEPPRAIHVAVSTLGLVSPPRLPDLSRQLGMSTRTLERRIREETGLTPTALRRVLRFRRAFRLLDRRPTGEWSGVAAMAGYFDQAHLIRDFRRFAGAPPSAFFRDDPALARALVSAEDPAA